VKQILTADDVGMHIDRYVRKLDEWPVPLLPSEPVRFFLELKRKKVTGGPYPGVSVFELANRVMSDLVVLFAARELLAGRVPGVTERIVRVEAALGTTHGRDLVGHFESGGEVAGECFNVASSFFAAKHSKARKDLLQAHCKQRLIAFNHDAVSDSSRFTERPDEKCVYLLVDVAAELAALVKRSSPAVAV